MTRPRRAMVLGLALAGLVGAASSVQATGLLSGSKDARKSPSETRPSGCEAFGPGFRKLEGSETCIKLGGSVRVESSTILGGGSRR